MTDWPTINRRRRETDHRPTDAFPDVAYVRALTGRDVVALKPWHPEARRPYEEPHRSGDLPRLVGITGKKRAGKDTFAKGLLERGFQRFAFADPLKDAALALDPLIRFEDDEASLALLTFEPGRYERLSAVVDRLGWEDAKTIREVRRTLQNFGVGIRDLDEDFWVRPLASALETAEAPLVVTDVRFPNEAEEIHRLGGFLLRIVRPDLESTDQHASETALDDYPVDAEVHNHGADALTEFARTVEFAF